jgi:hypothetical protein
VVPQPATTKVIFEDWVVLEFVEMMVLEHLSYVFSLLEEKLIMLSPMGNKGGGFCCLVAFACSNFLFLQLFELPNPHINYRLCEMFIFLIAGGKSGGK